MTTKADRLQQDSFQRQPESKSRNMYLMHPIENRPLRYFTVTDFVSCQANDLPLN